MNDIVWQSPGPLKNNNANTRSGRTKLFVAQLAERPGEWALYPVTISGTTGSASYRQLYPEVEWSVRSREDGKRDLYGRWIGPS